LFFFAGSKTEELKAARTGSSTYSPVFHHANGAGMLMTFVLGLRGRLIIWNFA
jgi:hypothetical protein